MKKKIALIILAILSVVLMCVRVVPHIIKPEIEKTDYTVFLEQVENQQIEEAVIKEHDGVVIYQLVDDEKTYKTNYPYTDDFVEKLLLSNIDVTVDTSTNSEIKSIVINVGSSLIMVALIVILLRKFMGGSDVNIQTAEHVNTKFDDIAGYPEIKIEMKDLVELLKLNKNNLNVMSIRLPRGVLLEGPPGNGKTLLARAIAGETGVNFIAVNACDFTSPFMGQSTAKINAVFEEARKNAPCIIFIDEIDAIGANRTAVSNASDKESNATLTAILNQMDGFTPLDNVLVIAATNMASMLDEALVRPGRFDRKYTIGNPDKKARQELFDMYLKGKNLDEEVDVNRLVTKTYGFSCAKIENLINEAALITLTSKREAITNADFDEAIIHILTNGSSKKEYDKNEDEIKKTAYHEAGHAIIAYKTGKTVNTISIIPTTSGVGGYTMSEISEDKMSTLQDYRNELMELYGGRAAETVLGGDISQSTNGCSNDIYVATQVAAEYISFKEGIDYTVYGEYGINHIVTATKTIMSEIWDEALAMITDSWDLVVAVAEALLEKESLNTEEFLEIVSEKKETEEKNEEAEEEKVS